MDEEDYEDDEDEEESESMILAIGKDGKASIHNQSDFVEASKEDMEIIQRFIGENKELFDEFLKKNYPDKSRDVDLAKQDPKQEVKDEM